MVEESQTQNHTVTVQLPGGRVATLLPRTVDTLFQYQEKSQKLGLASANLWMMTQCVSVNGEAITASNLNGLLKFRDRPRIDTALFVVEGEPTTSDGSDYLESENFTLPDGRNVEVLDPSMGIYDRYLEVQGKSFSKALGIAFKALFKIDGEPVTDTSLNKPYPEGIGYESGTFLFLYWSNFFSSYQPP